MGKTRIQIEIDTTGPFPAYITATVIAQATLDDGRVGLAKLTPQHRSEREPYTGADILDAIKAATDNAQSGPLPTSVDSFTRYKPGSVNYGDGPDGAFASIQRNWERLKQIDQEQKAKGELVGRYVDHPIADGQAVYQITNVNGGQVTIQVCRGLGDDWVLPAWGEKTTINRSTAEELVNRRDGLAALFASRRA